MSTEHPVVWVDLIEDKPLTQAEWEKNHPALDRSDQSATYRQSIDTTYHSYVERFQRFRWHATNAGNHKILARGERYFNRADALAAIAELFGPDTTVYQRQSEHGDHLLRMAYPNDLGEVTLLGPDIQCNADESVITWGTVTYLQYKPERTDDEGTAFETAQVIVEPRVMRRTATTTYGSWEEIRDLDEGEVAF